MAQTLAKAVSFFYALFLARSLGVENFGLYIVALSYFSLIAGLSDFGVSQYLIRESSIHPEKLSKLLTNAVFLRLTTVSLLFLFFSVFFYFKDPDHLRVSMTLLGILAVLPQSLALSLDSAFIAKQRLSLSAMGILILSFFTTFFGVLFISKGMGPIGAVGGLILGELILGLFNLYLIKKIKLEFKEIDFKVIKDVVMGGLPYGLLAILGLLYFKIDALMLNYLQGSYATGIYGAAYKFLEAVIFIPSAVNASIFPIMSSLSGHEPKKVYSLYVRSSLILLGLSILVVTGYFTILPIIITNYLPQYLPSIEVIKILALTIPFFFLIAPQSALLFSHKKFLKPLIIISTFNLVLNVGLNLVLIPRYSFIAAAWVTVFSDLTSFVIFLRLIKWHFRS
jgi:O-antigen/teichoic acid export membrane protein